VKNRGTFRLGKQAVHPPPSESAAQQASLSFALLEVKDILLVGVDRGDAEDQAPTHCSQLRALSAKSAQRREQSTTKQQRSKTKQETCNPN
jgi:hypothetical protein